MKFNHMVNYNGTYYEAGEDVPIKEKTPQKETVIPDTLETDEKGISNKKQKKTEE